MQVVVRRHGTRSVCGPGCVEKSVGTFGNRPFCHGSLRVSFGFASMTVRAMRRSFRSTCHSHWGTAVIFWFHKD